MTWYDDFDAAVRERFPDMEVLSGEPMARHTTFRIGGPARRLARPRSPEELAALLTAAEERGWPALVVGNGSNLLAPDDGLDRLVVHTGRLEDIAPDGPLGLHAQAGASLARLASFAQRRSLTGLEFAHGIPGSLGGGVRMNAGAYGGELCQVVAAVQAWLPGQGVRRLEAGELDFRYRHSVFMDNGGGVLSAWLALAPGDGAAIRERMEELGRRRREKQPLELPSGGSTFKRPAEGYAAALIEQCGLKGLSVGGAQVSAKHAGFVVNTGGATCADVRELVGLVQRRVLEETGVRLETEIEIV